MKRDTGFGLRGCQGWEAPWVIRKSFLAVAACLTLAACSSTSADVAAIDEPISILTGPTGVHVAEPRPPLLPEGVVVLAVPDERVIRVWEHPKSELAAF
jgi:hypothetical protein